MKTIHKTPAKRVHPQRVRASLRQLEQQNLSKADARSLISVIESIVSGRPKASHSPRKLQKPGGGSSSLSAKIRRFFRRGRA